MEVVAVVAVPLPIRLRDAHVPYLTQGPQKLCKIYGKQPTNDILKWEEVFQGLGLPARGDQSG